MLDEAMLFNYQHGLMVSAVSTDLTRAGLIGTKPIKTQV